MIVKSDTLVCDTLELARFQADGAYDYGRELQVPEKNLLEWLIEELTSWIHRVLLGVVNSYEFKPWLYILGVVILIVILYLAYRHRHRLFRWERARETAYHTEEDNIYGVDFTKEIDKALARADYWQAVRLKYLETLRWLADREMISWQIYKTPTQYVRELSSPHIGEFRLLTNHFIRIRYGNFAATRQLYDEVERLASEVCAEMKPADESSSDQQKPVRKEVGDEE